eukprot:g16471.t1
MSPVPGSARDLHHEDYDSLGCTGSLLCLGEEEVSSWRYVGEGKGHYMIVNDYKSVGEKKGSYSPRFERTYTRFRPRLSVVSACFILVALTILGAVAVAQAHSRLADGRSALRHAKHPGALGAYNCQADGSTLPMIKTLIHAAQRCEHADQDGNILMSNLNSCQERVVQHSESCTCTFFNCPSTDLMTLKLGFGRRQTTHHAGSLWL